MGPAASHNKPAAAARELKESGDAMKIVLAGAGTRWPALLNRDSHPFHRLFAVSPVRHKHFTHVEG